MLRPGPAAGTEAGNRKNRFPGLGPRPAFSIFQGKQLPGGLLQTPRDEDANVDSESASQAMLARSLPQIASSALSVDCGPKEAKRRPGVLALVTVPSARPHTLLSPASSYVPGMGCSGPPSQAPPVTGRRLCERSPLVASELNQVSSVPSLALILHSSPTAGNSQYPPGRAHSAEQGQHTSARTGV